jgi:lysophospholipase L1-like esterase/predicted esterase
MRIVVSGAPLCKHILPAFVLMGLCSFLEADQEQSSRPQVQDISFTSRHDGSVQKYILMEPATDSGDKPRSILVALHGHGSDRWQFVNDSRSECRAARDAAERFGMIYVSPDYRARTSWMGPAAEADMVQIIDDIRRSHGVEKVVICGGSMGGTAALTFAALHPQMVNGVVSMNGTANLVEYDQFQDAIAESFGGPISTHPDEYVKRSSELHADSLTMPIAFTTGGKDTVVPPASVLRLTEVLRDRGVPTLLIHQPEGGHETGYDDAIKAFDFVLGHVTGNSVEPAIPELREGHRTIVCFGDSVTGVYYHTGGLRAYPELLETALKHVTGNNDICVINAGRSGDSTQDALARIDADVLSTKPDIVVVSFGLNDMTRLSQEQFRANLVTIAARCRDAGAQVVFSTPNSVITTSGRPVEKLIAYCEDIRQTAAELKIPVCDQFAAGEELRERDPRQWRLELSDEIHPNLDGHRSMAAELCETLTGSRYEFSDTPDRTLALHNTISRLKRGDPVRLIAMPPMDCIAKAALQEEFPESKIETITWNFSGLTFPEAEKLAHETVRSSSPNLVIIALPDIVAESEEQFIHGVSWIMNWSLSFGHREWDCVVVFPESLSSPEQKERADMFRQLVRAQDLHLSEPNREVENSEGELLRQLIRSSQ